MSRYKPGAERLVNQPTKAWEGALDEMGRFGGGNTMRSVREMKESKTSKKFELPEEKEPGKGPGSPFCRKIYFGHKK